MKSTSPLNLCNRRLSSLRSHVGNGRRIPRSLIFCRNSSTLIKSDFSSFFFHNEQWTPSFDRPRKSERPSFKHITQVVVAAPEQNTLNTPLVVPRRTTLEGYRDAEVLTPRHLLKIYSQLSKSRLTVLNVLIAMGGVALSPLPTTVTVLLSTAVGVTLCSASANTLNQLQEVPLDAQMARTRMRPLVRHAITPLHAAGFAAVTGIAGPVILWTMTNPTTAMLGAANIVLYAGLYTWLKRKHVINTWVGAVVGAIPPVMGWTACGGHLLPSSSNPVEYFLPQFLSSLQNIPVDLTLIDNPMSPFALFMLLFSWQFPHFNSLSYVVRASYAQAGYRMVSVFSPSHNALVSFRHAILLIPICSILFPLSGLTTWAFALTSLVPNVIFTRAAWRYWKAGGEKQARAAFQHSLWYLPVIMGLAMVHKQGMDWAKWVGLKKDEGTEVS